MDDRVWRRGFGRLCRYGFSFDLQTPWWHLDAAVELARDFPQTTIILNHTALPSDRSPEGLDDWRRNLENAASVSNIMLKISGLGQPSRAWRVEDNGHIIQQAIEIFGPERCMFASNFPVDSLVASFEEVATCFLRSIADRSIGEQQMLVHDNAKRIYRL